MKTRNQIEQTIRKTMADGLSNNYLGNKEKLFERIAGALEVRELTGDEKALTVAIFEQIIKEIRSQ